MVLVDHIDDIIERHEFFTRWTLKGLGFSDAAEAFVFLSGFTFGWVYSTRLDRDGFWTVQLRALIRTVQIYAAMMLTTLFAAGLAWWLSRSIRLPLTITSRAMFNETLWEAALLREPIWGLGILVVYVAVLPFLPALLWLARRSVAAAIAVSLSIYAGSQLVSALSSGDAGFNPLAWQLLVVSGLVLGEGARRGQWGWPKSRLGLVLAMFVLVTGVVALRLSHILNPGSTHEAVRSQLSALSAFSKTNLGVARVAHFAAVALVTAFALERWPRIPEQWWAKPLVISGRHSLTLFCLGVLLAYLSTVAARFLPDNLLTLIFVALDAVLVQFAAAWWLEQRSARRQTH